MRRESGELEKVDEPRGGWLILASGGPLMREVCTEGDNVLCEWDSPTGPQRRLFDKATLRRLVPYLSRET